VFPIVIGRYNPIFFDFVILNIIKTKNARIKITAEAAKAIVRKSPRLMSLLLIEEKINAFNDLGYDAQKNMLNIKDYDFYDANIFLVPTEKTCNMDWKLITRINVAKITSGKNPYCVDVDDGLKIRKEFYDGLVTIE